MSARRAFNEALFSLSLSLSLRKLFDGGRNFLRKKRLDCRVHARALGEFVVDLRAQLFLGVLHFTREEDGDGLAREGAGDAEAVAEDGDGDHLVLGHLGHELVVGGLLREGKRLGQRVVQMV